MLRFCRMEVWSPGEILTKAGRDTYRPPERTQQDIDFGELRDFCAWKSETSARSEMIVFSSSSRLASRESRV